MDQVIMTNEPHKRAFAGVDFKALGGLVFGSGLWLLVLTYFLAYLPTYIDLSNGPWQTDQDGHGLYIHIISLVFFAVRAQELSELPNDRAPVVGWFMIISGMFFLALGRSQSQLFFSAGSQIPILLGMVFLLRGWAGFRLMWFPIFFLAFAVPLPGWMVDGVTHPMKLAISSWATQVLSSFGYPVSQNGVVLTAGPYTLLVKTACAGLNSLYGLLAVGVIYVYLTRGGMWLRSLFLTGFLLPAAVISNFIRVILLVLLTYHFGEEVGQGFMHDFAGLFMFVMAVLVFLVADSIWFTVARLLKRFTNKRNTLS